MNDKVYIHEYIDIIGHHRADYMHHMTANWSPMAQAERGQKCFGVWGTVGTTRRWPEVVNLWEEDGYDGLAQSFRHEFNHPSLQDPSLAAWWSRAAQFRRAGVDRVLVPAEWTMTIDELCEAGIRGETYAHEFYPVRPGSAREFLERVRTEAVPLMERFGWVLAGAWVTAMRNDTEAFVLWAIPTWEDWARYESAQYTDPGVVAWRNRAAEYSDDWNRFLLVDAPLSPLRTGRQPRESDRDSYRLPD